MSIYVSKGVSVFIMPERNVWAVGPVPEQKFSNAVEQSNLNHVRQQRRVARKKATVLLDSMLNIL